MTPVAVRAAPANGENSVEQLLDLRLRAIAQRREIRNQPGVPKEDRDGKVSRDRENVPEERAAEVRPDAVVIRERREIPRHPDAADVDAWENRGANDGEERHRFGGAVDGGAPFLPEQEQDRGDEGAGVSDTDPENEVGDVPSPADRMIQSPGADAGRDLVAETEEAERRHHRSDGKRDPPPAGRVRFDDAGDALGDPTEVPLVQNKRRPNQRLLRRSGCFALDRIWCCGCAVHGYSAVIPSRADGEGPRICKLFSSCKGTAPPDVDA